MKVLDIAFKDMLRSFRSLFAVGMMLAAPLLIAGMIYAAFGGLSQGNVDLPAMHVGLVDLDAPPAGAPADLGQTIVDMFTDPSLAGWLVAEMYPDPQAARAALDRQAIGAAVIIPAGLTEALVSGKEGPPVRIVQDPTLSVGPMVVRNMVSSLLEGVAGAQVAVEVIQERHEARGLAVDMSALGQALAEYQAWYTTFQRSLFHDPESAALRVVSPAAEEQAANSIQQLMGATMAGQMVFFAFYTGAYAMTSILREQEEGTLARLFTTPTNRILILAGKFLAVLITVVVQSMVLMAAARLAFGVRWGQPGSVLLALVGQVIAATGLGVLLIAPVKNTRQAGPVLGGGLTALGMLSGLFTVTIPNLPAFFERLSLFTPQGRVLQIWRLAMAGAPLAEMIVPVVVIVAVGAVMFVIGALLFRRRFA